MLYIVFIAVAIAFGYALVRNFKLELNHLEEFAVSTICGIVYGTILTFILANFFKLNTLAILSSLFCMTLVILVSFKKRQLNLSLRPFPNLFINKGLTVTLVFFIILFTKIFFQQFVTEQDGLYAGWIGSWGDGSYHLTLINSFTYGDNFFPKQPVFAGAKLDYPFLPDFLSSVLLKLGASLNTATGTPAVVLLTSATILMYSIFHKLTNSKLTSCFAIFIAFFTGGAGFLYFLGDFTNLSWLTFPPREYTNIENANIRLINFLTSALVPQRAFLFGLPIFLSIYSILKIGIEKLEKRYFIFAAALISTLPFIHAHTLLTLGIVLPAIALVEISRRNLHDFKKTIYLWVILGFIVIIMLIPQLIIFLPGTRNIMHFQFGWMAHVRNDNIILFWLKNTGVLIPLSLLAIILLKGLRLKFLIYYFPFTLVFIIANLIIFQPYEYDNSKVFYYWYIFSAPIAAWSITKLFHSGFFFKLVSLVLFIILILSGALDIYRLTNYQKNKILMFDNESLELANFVAKNTDPHSVFVTAPQHNHPISAAAGRTILMGFPGWLWTYGIDYSSRERDIRIIYEDQNQSQMLLDKYSVNYLVIGPTERTQFTINENFFEKNFQLIYKSQRFKIYEI